MQDEIKTNFPVLCLCIVQCLKFCGSKLMSKLILTVSVRHNNKLKLQ